MTKSTTDERSKDDAGRYASVDGLRMYYEIHGTGEPLVLFHGAFTTINGTFGRMLPSLAKTRQVIAIEQQGHGHTADIDRPLSYEQMAEDTAALLRQLAIENADFIAYSMGTGIALEIAVRHPDLVRRLVLASPAYARSGFHPGVLEGIETIRPEAFAGSPLPEEYARTAPNPEDWPVLIEKVKHLDGEFQGWPPEEIQAIQAPTLIAGTVLANHARGILTADTDFSEIAKFAEIDVLGYDR